LVPLLPFTLYAVVALLTRLTAGDTQKEETAAKAVAEVEMGVVRMSEAGGAMQPGSGLSGGSSGTGATVVSALHS
jgi:hypothetical protein